MITIFWLLAAFALVFLNAFFVAAEFGMVRLRHTHIPILEETYPIRGRILAQVYKQLDAYLSACQLGITLASLGLGWIGEPAFAVLLKPLFQLLHLGSPEIVKVISFFSAFSIISFLHIVVGELMPKSLAIRKAESISLWTALPLLAFYWLMYPAIWLLNGCSNILLKTMGLNTTQHGQSFYSTKEIKLILSASRSHGELTKEETEIIEHTLDFADLKVTEVMRPRTEMVTLEVHKPAKQLLKIVFEQRYSRYPVYDKVKEDVIGIIHIKDLFAAVYEKPTTVDLASIVRPVLKVPHHLRALDMLYQFREGMSHFAFVYNDKKRLIGFVTLDNLLHILIGRIKDEFHKTQDDWVINKDDTLQVKGDCSLYSLEKAIHRKITPGVEKVNTLAGLILNQAGVLPQEGERIVFPEFDAVIERIQGTHIEWVKVYPKNQKPK